MPEILAEEMAFREVSRDRKEQEHVKTEAGKQEPEAGVGRACRGHSEAAKPGPVGCCLPGLSRAAFRASARLEVSREPWPTVRLEQGSCVSGFENAPEIMLLEFNIYPEASAS